MLYQTLLVKFPKLFSNLDFSEMQKFERIVKDSKIIWYEEFPFDKKLL